MKMEPSKLALAIEMRSAHWSIHPIVLANAKLPTPAVTFAVSMATAEGMVHRSSVAFWAHPAYGKSFCLEVLRNDLPHIFLGCGIFVYEVKPKSDDTESQPKQKKQKIEWRENILLADILVEMEYEGHIEHNLPKKRAQVKKALYGIAGPARHLFMLLDEAQGLDEDELKIFKTLINYLVKTGIRVTVVLMGQIELLEQRENISNDYRSDLDIRFTASMYELPGIKSAEDLEATLEACDTASDFPPGSGLTYTQFLFPEACSQGFKLRAIARSMWECFMSTSPIRANESGVAMSYIARALSHYVNLMREHDGPHMQVDPAIIAKAVKASGYATRKAVRSPVSMSKKGTS